MKRGDFLRELHEQGCYLLRHGSNHDLYRNYANGRKAPIPRHSEIKNSLCEQIRRQLGISSGKPVEN